MGTGATPNGAPSSTPSSPASTAAAPSTPSAPATPAASPAAPAAPSRLSDLTQGYLPAERPTPEPTPEPSEPQPEPVPAQQKFKIRGKEYTREEVFANEELLQSLLTMYEQFPTLQKKYTDVLEQARQAQQYQQQQPQAQPPQDPRVYQAQLLAKYAPKIGEAVNAGYIEPDFAQLYPNLAAQMLAHRDEIYMINDRLEQLSTTYSGQTKKAEAQGHRTQLDANLDQLAARTDMGEIFKPLKDPKEREGFLQFLVELDPVVSKLTPEWLGRQWLAYKHETILTATQAAAERERTQRETDRKRAAGDGKSARPAPAPKGEPSFLDSLIEERLPLRR